MDHEVQKRRRGESRVSTKHQVTIPAEAMRAAGLRVGDRLVATAEGAGRVVLERADDPLADYAGALTGIYGPGYLDRLRAEWA
jgi:AbrB family looped-hinge helix DNA binding protein